MLFRTCGALAAFAVLAPSPAAGQISFEDKGWLGEVRLSGAAKTGNTESTDVGFGAEIGHETTRWRNAFQLTLDYGSADGAETKNRTFVAHQVDRLVNHRLYVFGRGALELDEFDGYEHRGLAAAGFGYDVLIGEQRTWSLQGGPAYQIDRLEAVIDPMTLAQVAPARDQTALAASLGSRFFAQVNDAVSFTNDTDLASSADTTTIFNTSALTADLVGAIAARFSVDVAHDTEPPLGAEATDTTTRVSLVYTFGD